MLIALIHLVGFFNLKASYEGLVLARLPFTPFSFIQGITHRNLPGTDMSDCCVVFIYMLCSMSIKPSLQRALGQNPPKTAVPAGIQRLAEKWSGVADLKG